MRRQMVLSSECSAAICYDRGKWNNALKVLKKENVNMSQGFLCSARLTFEHKEHKLLITWHGRVETPLFPRARLQESAEECASDKQVRCPRHRHQASAQHWTPGDTWDQCQEGTGRTVFCCWGQGDLRMEMRHGTGMLGTEFCVEAILMFL